MAAIFRKKIFCEIWAEYLANVPWDSKISTKLLYLAPLMRYKQFCVFVENSKIQNGHLFRKWKYFFYLGRLSYTMEVENFNEITLSRTVNRNYKQFCVFAENLKIQNGHHFLEDQKILNFGQSILLRYPGGWKFSRNRSILHH